MVLEVHLPQDTTSSRRCSPESVMQLKGPPGLCSVGENRRGENRRGAVEMVELSDM